MNGNDTAQRIFAHHQKLQYALAHQGGAIYKLWHGLTPLERRQKLRIADRGLHAHHRPDIGALLARNTKDVRALIVPFLNIDDLVKGDNLMTLLHTRGRTQPHELVHADFEAATLMWSMRGRYLGPSDGTAMILHGQTKPATYGKLVPVGSAFFTAPGQYICRRKGLYRPEVGRRIMTSQLFILNLLVNIIDDITSNLPNSGRDINASMNFPISTQQVYGSLGEFSIATSYERPSYAHLARLNEIVKSERDLKEDHIWALREDPGYFSEKLKEEVDHDWEVKQDQRGKCSIRPKNQHGNSTVWGSAAEHMIKDAYTNFQLFDELSTLGKEFLALAEKYDATQWRRRPIPQELLETYLRLKYILKTLESETMQQIRLGLAMSPPLRNKIEVVASYAPHDGKPTLVFDGVKILSKGFGVDRLMRILSVLYDPASLSDMPVHILMDAVDSVVEGNPACHKLLSSWITVRLSTLSVVAEYQHQLNRLHPWIGKAEEEIGSVAEKIVEEFSVKHGSRWEMSDCSPPDQLPTLRDLADPSDKKFYYPIEKPRSREVVDACRKAESHLDNFWAKFDLRVRNEEGESFYDLVVELMEQGRTVQRTPVWSDRKPPRSQVLTIRLVGLPPAEPRRQKPTQDSHVQDSSILPESNASQVTDTSEPDDHTGATEPVFLVDQRAKVVLEALFHSAAARNRHHSGEISWAEFKYTMCKVGFSGCKLRGSIWNFVRRREDILGNASLNFHEPHPSNKCSFNVVRCMGRRITRRLGWTGEMFGASR